MSFKANPTNILTMENFMKRFFNNPYSIKAYGRLPDFINTSMYFIDFRKQKLFIKDPVVNALHELYPISHGAHIKFDDVDRDNTILTFNGCIPFHIAYSIIDHLNRNNNYPVLVPRIEEDLYTSVNINIYTKYWMKRVDENDLRQIIYDNIKGTKVYKISLERPFSGYIPYYGLFFCEGDESKILVKSKKCPVENYLGSPIKLISKYNGSNSRGINIYTLNADNIPYYTSRYLIDKIRDKNLLINFEILR